MRMAGNESETNDQGDGPEVREIRANGQSVATAEVEAKLDGGNVQEAESSLQEGLSLSSEVPFLNSIYCLSVCQQSL